MLNDNDGADAAEAMIAAECEDATLSVLSEVLTARSSFYEMLASFYFYPLTQEQIDRLAEMDLSPYADINDDLAAGINDLTHVLRKRHTGTREQLAVDFTSAFAGASTYEGRTAAPYKSVFTSDEGLLMQESYQEIFRTFKAERVRRKQGFDWPEDHLSFLFQFMALLSRRADDALREHDAAAALHNLEVSQEFLNKHILSWFDDFQDMANLLLKTRFYRGVLKITKGYLNLDLETIADLIENIRVAQ